jgi:hypothetical protein
MADVNKNVSVSFKAIDNMSRAVNSMKQDLKQLGDATKKLSTDSKENSKASKQMENSMMSANIKSELLFGAMRMGIGIVQGLASAMMEFGRDVVSYLGDASRSAQEFNVKMGTLNIIAGRFGQDGAKATATARRLGKELQIGVGASAEALQNLLASGLNLEQAEELMRRFTNEAITGKSANISLADAVQNLAFAYKTGNSALGNMSGMSENWLDIMDQGKSVIENYTKGNQKWIRQNPELVRQIKDYEAQLAKSGRTLTATDQEQQKYLGTMQLTNLTVGSAKALTNDLMTAQNEMATMSEELRVNIGEGLNVALSEMARVVMPELKAGFQGLMTFVDNTKLKFQEWWISNKDFIEPQLARLRDAFEAIKQKFLDLVAPLNGSQEQFNQFANGALRNAIDRTIELADGIGDVIDYFASDDGRKAMTDFGNTLRIIAEVMSTVVSHTEKLISMKKGFEDIYRMHLGLVTLGGSEVARVINKQMTKPRDNNAMGTSFFSGGVANVGEMGREQVVLPRGTKILNNKKTEGGGGGVTINVNAPVYGVDNLVATVTKAVTEAQARQNQLAGYNLL